MLVSKVIMNPWFAAMRPKTLPASVSPIILGSALAYANQDFSFSLFIIAIGCALSLQIAVNFANDYFDGVSGVDTSERLGPVRASQSSLVSASAIYKGCLLFSCIALCLGFILVWQSHWQLIWFGLFSLIAVFAYSGGPWPLASKGLGEISVFFFFGWLAVAGAYFIQTGDVPAQLLIYGSSVGCLSAAIMLVNNIRDIKTDAKAGKYTLALRLGDKASRLLYVALLLGAMATHIAASLPSSNAWLLYSPIIASLLPTYLLCQGIFTRKGAALNKQLSQTALLLLLYCLTTSAVLILLVSSIL